MKYRSPSSPSSPGRLGLYALGLLISFLATVGCESATPISVAVVEARRIEVSFSERAETHIRREFPVSLPESGRIERIEWEPGDLVREGERLVVFDSTPMDLSIEAQQARLSAQRVQEELSSDLSVEQREIQAAQQRVLALRAELGRMDSALSAARVALENAQRESARVTALVDAGALPTRDLERIEGAQRESEAQLDARRAERESLQARVAEAQASVESWRARLERRRKESEAASAAVREQESRERLESYRRSRSEILSPIDGTVLERKVRGPQELSAGTVLLTLGRRRDIEAICDVLSQDALRLQRGTTVLLDPGSDREPLKGEVRLLEPQGFTKRSSLGVEQQRVRVHIGLLDPPEGLGTGYELWARFLLQQKTARSLPGSAFVRREQDYSVWRLDAESRLESVPVVVGTKGDRYWEIADGALEDGDRVVDNPTSLLQTGLLVKVEPDV